MRGEEAGHFREVAGRCCERSAFTVDNRQPSARGLRSIERCLVVLWMLASFLHCHSNTKTLNLTVCEFRRGGAYARDKNTSARLWAKNAGGAYARGGAYLRDTTVHGF